MSDATLYLVGVPIGNDGDMTPRAHQILETVDVIAAEDTRKAKALFVRQNLNPSAQLIAHHAHNEHQSIQGVIKLLQEGKSVALITDAGMPAISDPGYLLVKEAKKHDVSITCAPGANAALAALALSGIPSDRFYFIGFLPTKTGERVKYLEKLKNFPDTMIFYEAPHRVLKCVQDIEKVFQNNPLICIARELTKTHEEIVTMPVQDALKVLENKKEILGEHVFILQGNSCGDEISEAVLNELIQSRLAEGMHPKEIRDTLSNTLNISKKTIYNKILEIKSLVD